MSFKIGKIGESIVFDLFSKYFKVDFNESKDVKELIKWDISFLNKTAEVKYDAKAALTGNIAIEIHNTRQDTPSGISATTADYWIIVLSKNEVWITETYKLVNFISKRSPYRTVRGGDNNSLMFLYKKESILGKIFTRINDANINQYFQR